MRWLGILAVLSIASAEGGCAHVSRPPPSTAMVEVTDGSIVPGPSPRPNREPPVTMPRRRALFIAGGVLIVVGAVTTGIGVGAYVHGAESEASCMASDGSCSFGGGFERAIGSILLGVAVPHLAAGIALVGAGAATHR